MLKFCLCRVCIDRNWVMVGGMGGGGVSPFPTYFVNKLTLLKYIQGNLANDRLAQEQLTL